MNKSFLLITLFLMLVACSPSPQAIQTAIAQTQAANPTMTFTPIPPTNTPTETPTPTLVPFSSLQLDNLVIQPNDLPSGFSGSQISNQSPNVTDNSMSADYYIQQELTYTNETMGKIQVWVFKDQNQASFWYNQKIKDLNDECKPQDPYPSLCLEGVIKVPNVGEGANMIQYLSLNLLVGMPDTGNYYTLVFYHCHALISIQMQGHNLDDSIMTYANRLDGRLKSSICR